MWETLGLFPHCFLLVVMLGRETQPKRDRNAKKRNAVAVSAFAQKRETRAKRWRNAGETRAKRCFSVEHQNGAKH